MTTLGSGVDGSVRALGYDYTAMGLPFRQTSYSDASATTALNQVREDYNGYGQIVTQYQEQSGRMSAASAKVQYAYSTAINASRPTSMTYPNGRVLNYAYNTGLDSDISRVSELDDAAGTGTGSIEAYTYLGLDTIVQRLDGNGIELTYIKQSGESNGAAGDQYTGLDAFGRVDDQRWIPASSPTTPTDRFQYAYDRDGNVLYKNNLVNSTFSELYHANSSASGDNNAAYDNLNRLQAFSRGALSSSGHNGSGLDTVTTLNSNADSSQSWTLDAVGNQSSVTTDGTAQSNSFDSQNQQTAAGATSLTFDNNGNTTYDGTNFIHYDAGNRAVSASGSFIYDANGNVMTELNSATDRRYYSISGQVLEERDINGATTNQYVWSLAYVNAPVERDDNSTPGSYGKSASGLGRRLYAQQDANFNVTALTNTSGTVQQRFDYTPYGIATTLDGTTTWATTTNSLSWVYTFQGGRADLGSGLVHLGEREYAPTLARWGQQDPAGFSQGANKYQFVDGDPALLVDPSGLGAMFRKPGENPAPGSPTSDDPPQHPTPPAESKPCCKTAPLSRGDFFRSWLDNTLGNLIYSAGAYAAHNFGIDGFYLFVGISAGSEDGGPAGQAGVGFQWSLDEGYYFGAEAYGGANDPSGIWGMTGGWYGYSQDNGLDPLPYVTPADPTGSGDFMGYGPVEWGKDGAGGTNFIGWNIGDFNFGFTLHPDSDFSKCLKSSPYSRPPKQVRPNPVPSPQPKQPGPPKPTKPPTRPTFPPLFLPDPLP